MKKMCFVFGIVISACILSSCGHNLGIAGIGAGFRVGNGEYGIAYGDGVFGTFATKDGVTFRIEMDSTMGVTYDPNSDSYKGIKSMEYSVAPQINGYAVEFAKDNPEVARLYYEALVKYYETKKEMAPAQQPLISDEKSKDATSNIRDILQKALDKAKSIINNLDPEDKESSFHCDGNCEYDNLGENKDLAYQLSIAMKLLTYDGYSKKFDTGEYYTTTLQDFVTKLVKYQAQGNTTTPLRVKYVTVKDKVITRLMYVMEASDGTDNETDCPQCCVL